MTVRKSLAYTFSTSYLIMLVQFVTSIILARLLVPSEVGIFSIAAGIVTMGQILREFGTTQYLLVEKELTRDRIRAAYTVTLAVGISIGAIVWLAARPVAIFYDSPGVEQVMHLMAVNYFLLPFGTIPAALQRRDMNFVPSSITRTAAALMLAAVTIGCAFAGLSYMSMAWGTVASAVTSIVVINFFRPKGLPLLPGLGEVRHVLSFGVKSSGVDIIRQIGATAPELIVGKTLGLHESGLLSRTFGTMTMFASLVTSAGGPVLTPYFSKLRREQKEVGPSYRFIVTCVTGLAWPFYGSLAFAAPYFVETLFGPKWIEIVPLVQVLCLGQMVYHSTSMLEQVLTATGHIDRTLRITTIGTTARVIVLGTAAFFSLTHVVIANLCLSFLRFFTVANDLKTYIGLGFRAHLQIAAQSAPLGVAAACGAASVRFVLGTQAIGHAALLAASIVAALAGWTIALALSNHPLKAEIVRVARRLRQKT